MSTTYTLLPIGGDDNSLPSIDITESGMEYDITCWGDPKAFDDGGNMFEFENLTADQVLGIAFHMIRIVLFQYPEKIDQVRSMKL